MEIQELTPVKVAAYFGAPKVAKVYVCLSLFAVPLAGQF